MKRFFAIFGALVFLLLLVCVGLLAWVLTFDANENKDWIATKFQENTGRELILGGDIEVSIYPWLGLNANDVSVGNAVGFNSDPLFHADKMALRVKLLPLLNKEFEIDTVAMDGVHINLEVAGNGRNNWSSFGASTNDTTTSTPEAAKQNSGPLFNKLIIGGVRINNASLMYHDDSANTHYEVDQFNLNIAELSYGDPLEITMSMEAASRTPELGASVSLNGTVLYDVDAGRYELQPLALSATLLSSSIPSGSAAITLNSALTMDVETDTLKLDNFHLDALGTQVTATVQATRVQTATPAIKASIEAKGENLALLFRILEQNELADRISSLKNSFTLSASIDADMSNGSLTLSELDAELLNSSILGTIVVDNFKTDNPAIVGNLNASGPDLPTLIEVVGMVQGGRNSQLSSYGRELSRVPDKSYRIQTRFNANLEQDTVEVPELYMSLFGATINGSFTASNFQNSEALVAEGTLNAQGPDLPLLMQIAGQLQGGRDAALNVYGNQLRSSVRNRAFTFTTEFNADLANGNVQLPTLNAAMLGFRLNGNINALDIQNNGAIGGSLTLAGDNLREVLIGFDQPELAEVIQSMDLRLDLGGSSNNLRLSPLRLSAVLAGKQIPNSPQSLILDADTLINLDTSSLRAEAFSLNGLGLNLNGTLSANDLSGALNYSGDINVPAFNARRFLQQINQPLPPMTDNSTLQSVALSSAFGGTANSFNLNNMKVLLDQSTITGSLAISDLATQAMQFTVNIDQLDADRYMAPATTAPSTSTAQAEPLPVDTLRALNLKGVLDIGSLTVNRLSMRDINIELNASKGEISLYPFKASLYEGSFDGDIRLNAAGSPPTARVSTALQNVNLEPLLLDFMDASYVTGISNIQMSLSGSGADTASIKRSLNGNGTIALQDGVLQGVDVSAVLKSLETMIRNRQVQALPQGGSTAFEESSATLAINNGLVSTNNLTVKAPGWKLGGTGTLIDLNDDSIKFNMLVQVDESTVTTEATEYNLGGYSLPIACTGTTSSPRCLPDAKQIIASAVGSVLQQRLGDLLQNRQGNSTQDTPDDSNTAPQSERNPGEELLNRALDRLIRKD